MPKINAYLPDRLGKAARHYAIPISAVCQQAIEAEVRTQLPLLQPTPRAREVLHGVAKEAGARGHTYIGTEHLLLGLLGQTQGIAAQVLERLQFSAPLREALEGAMATLQYGGGSHRVTDRHGNLLGYLVAEDEGRLRLVDDAGQAVALDHEP